MRGFIIALLVSGAIWNTYAQVHTPIKWQISTNQVSDSQAQLIFTAILDDGWHIYSQAIEEGGPLPTTFSFEPSDTYSRVGKVEEFGTPVKSYDNTFMMDITWFAQTVVFKQKVDLHEAAVTIKGKIEFMVCTDEMCLPPETKTFSLEIRAINPRKNDSKRTSEPRKPKTIDNPEQNSSANIDTTTSRMPNQNPTSPTVNDDPTDSMPRSEKSSVLWGIFFAGIVGGLAALFMPCIFPMIPLTISFFNGRTNNRPLLIATLYGASIILLYVGLGFGITVLFGSSAMNELATNGIFNFFFFVLLTLFAASLLGAFEIILPASWSTAADRRSDRSGLIGIFFMAATLALVSFSCTAPIIGTLLVEAATVRNYMAPVAGMFGFSLALALPFSLFAMFPSWLKSLPKSGGWLNSIKVTLGFLELALALKFLSNVDLAYHWNWLDREVFLVLWIIIFGLLGFYLLGKLKLTHDTDVKHISTPRLFLAIITLAFTLYMIPGLWGAPLKVISAFLPPAQTQDFDLYSYKAMERIPGNSASYSPRKYEDIFESPLNIGAFFDYDEGIAYARNAGKPVMIDFTGHACVNCRKMEAEVWTDPRVLNRLQNDFVVIQLYVDDKTELESEEKYKSTNGKVVTTIGGKWSDLEATAFGTNAQPWYVLLGHDGEALTDPQGAEYDAEIFSRFLDKGLGEFERKMKSR